MHFMHAIIKRNIPPFIHFRPDFSPAEKQGQQWIIHPNKKKPTGIAGGSSYAAQGPILPAARLRACGLFTCILLLATRKRVFKIQC